MSSQVIFRLGRSWVNRVVAEVREGGDAVARAVSDEGLAEASALRRNHGEPRQAQAMSGVERYHTLEVMQRLVARLHDQHCGPR
jgi:hypothetical protein